MPEGSQFIKPAVENFVTKLSNIDKIKEGIYFAEKLKLVGSVSENTKISVPDEFDFLWEIKIPDKEKLEITQVYPDTFKPRQKGNIRPRMCFKLKYKDGHVPMQWKRERMQENEQNGIPEVRKGERPEAAEQFGVLEARKAQEDFKSILQEAMNCYQPKNKKCIETLMNGPAVTLALELTDETIPFFTNKNPNKENKWKEMAERKEPLRIKVDITLAIQIKKKELGLREKDKADINLKEGEDLYLVPSGDFWSLSCSHLEKSTMEEISGREIDCYKVLKVGDKNI